MASAQRPSTDIGDLAAGPAPAAIKLPPLAFSFQTAAAEQSRGAGASPGAQHSGVYPLHLNPLLPAAPEPPPLPPPTPSLPSGAPLAGAPAAAAAAPLDPYPLHCGIPALPPAEPPRPGSAALTPDRPSFADGPLAGSGRPATNLVGPGGLGRILGGAAGFPARPEPGALPACGEGPAGGKPAGEGTGLGLRLLPGPVQVTIPAWSRPAASAPPPPPAPDVSPESALRVMSALSGPTFSSPASGPGLACARFVCVCVCVCVCVLGGGGGVPASRLSGPMADLARSLPLRERERA